MVGIAPRERRAGTFGRRRLERGRIIPNILPTPPSAVQAMIPIRPPGLVTRAIWRALAS